MKKFTPEDDKFLLDNALIIPAKRMSIMLGRSESSARQRMKLIGIQVPPEIIEKFKKGSQFSKGHQSFNKGKKQSEYMSKESIARTKKTRFKKGHLTHNTAEKDGTIVVRHEHPDRHNSKKV